MDPSNDSMKKYHDERCFVGIVKNLSLSPPGMGSYTVDMMVRTGVFDKGGFVEARPFGTCVQSSLR